MSLSKDDLRQALDIYTANDPSGGRLFKVDIVATVADDVNATIIGGVDDDGDPITEQAPVLVGGEAEDVASLPTFAAGDVVMDRHDKDTGAKIVLQGDLDYTTDSVVAYGKTVTSASTVTFSVGGAGATADYMGTSTTPQSFASVVRVNGGTGIIKSISLVDKTATAAVDLELWLYSATFTAPTDNAAWTISDTDALLFVGVIKITGSDWVASAANKAYSDDTISLPIKPAATSLFYALVARGATPAWSTGDLQITLGILQD